jgi:hypothetical protein
MKNIIFLSLFFPLLLMGQKQVNYSGILKAHVSGDTVTIFEDTAWRNCGAMYNMKAWIQEDTLYWYQIDTGWSFGCLCCFNLSLTVDSLKTGHYTAKVFYTEYPDWPPPYPDTVYSGSVQFDITEQNSYPAINTVNQFQSDCFTYTALDDENEVSIVSSVFPNPVQSILHLNSLLLNKKSIKIYDLQGRRLYYNITNRESLDIDFSNFENGIYLLSIENGTEIDYIKVIKSR